MLSSAAAFSLPFFLCLATAPVNAQGDEPPTREKQEKERYQELQIGDPAPDLGVSEWFKGVEVPKLEKGKVYLIEFWATWCAPCVEAMPHLTELQKKYKAEGLTVVGITRPDNKSNTVYAIKEMIKDKGDIIGYSIGFDEKGVSYKRYMEASDWNRIPRTFLVDRDGRVAYMGHPSEVDDALAQVLKGTYDIEAAAKKQLDEIRLLHRQRAIEARINQAYKQGQWAEVLLALDDMISMGPQFNRYAVNKFSVLLVQMKDYEGAYAYAIEAAETVLAGEANYLNTIAWTIVGTASVEQKDLDVALDLCGRANELEKGKNATILNVLAMIHFQRGDVEAAIETQKKCIEVADGRIKANYARKLKEYEDAKNKK